MSTDSPRRIAIVGGSIWGNRGAEAMVSTTAGMIRQRWPDAEIFVFSYMPKQDRALTQGSNVVVCDATPLALVLRLFPAALACRVLSFIGLRLPDAFLPLEARILRRCDAMLDVFGISFSDGREAFLPFNILSILPAMLLRVPVIKLSQAVGPFERALNRTLARVVLRRCEHVFARGASSADHLSRLPLSPEKYSRAADTAFSFRDSFSLTSEGAEFPAAVCGFLSKTGAENRPVTGICPSSVVLKKAQKVGVDYIGVFAEVARGLVARGHCVVVLPNATRGGEETLRNNDLPVIRLLRTRCREFLTDEELDRIYWIDSDINTANLRGVIEQLGLLLTSRFHAMIAALSLQKPVIVLGWSHKYREVLEEFGLENACFGFETDDVGRILAEVENLIEADFRSRWPVAERLQAARTSSASQYEYTNS